jgi:hypothetical protein
MAVMRMSKLVEAGRIRTGPLGSDPSYGANGAFQIVGPMCATLHIIASDGVDPVTEGWEHVSVSLSNNRCPNWPEMCFVKNLFWGDEETVIQFHPPRSEYVNHHPTTLHLWRHRYNAIATPPSILVGPK